MGLLPDRQTRANETETAAKEVTGGFCDDEAAGSDAADKELSPETREELLDPEGWREVLVNYALTVGLAVSLTDCAGRQSGACHNAQAIWLMAQSAKSESNAGPIGSGGPACSFCLDPPSACQAVKIALSTGTVQVVHDRSGLVHLAVPLSLGRNQLGALIAGQVFDLYPEPLKLQRMARNLAISAEDLWRLARLQPPVRTATLHIYGDLLRSLGNAFLRQRYADILERKLTTANQRLRLLLGGIQDHALFTINEMGVVTTWNCGAERLFGHTESDMVGQDFSILFTSEDVEAGAPSRLLERASADGVVSEEGWQLRKDGTRFFVEGSLAVLGKGSSREFGRLTHDITERRNRDQALLQTQKLESIGVLASGIAHDFNNLLTPVLGGVSFALSSLTPDHPAYEMLTFAQQGSESAAGLAHQLLAYAGQGKFVVTHFDLSALILDMVNLLRTSLPKSVVLELSLEPNLPWIEADESQIQQIVMNLVINGAEAIGPGGGSLAVSTGKTGADAAAIPTGSEVWMEVRDSGSGMTEATKARIFDPFFTTKFTGRGLGLAAVSGIVRGHHGRMEVHSEVGKGTTFRICFPALKASGTGRAHPALFKDKDENGTVLVVEDVPGLRKVAQLILERAGHRVLVAQNGEEAVDLFRQNADIIRVILLDMNMPTMGGKEAFRQIRSIRADVPVVVSTGENEVATREIFKVAKDVWFVRKPYTAGELCDRIRIASQTVQAVHEAGLP